MNKLRIGIVGKRGTSGIAGFQSRSDVEIAAFCDKNPEVVERQTREHGVAQGYESFEAMLDHVDAVVLGTPVQFHVPQAILALQAGKHVLSEVPAAVSIDECWRLLDAVQASDGLFMLAENYCYFEENVLVREMARKGLFGDLYFGEGEYIHEVRKLHHNPDGSPTWRYFWQVGYPGNTYPTHEIGPVMHWFRAQNPNESIDFVSCMGSGVHTDPEHPHDDVTITIVKLSSGRLIKLHLDMMSNRPHSVAFSLQGVNGAYDSHRGVWIGANEALGFDDPPRTWSPLKEFHDHFPAEWLPHLEAARQSGHGGGDYHTARLFVEAIRGERANDIDVYDALDWTAVGLCSAASIVNGGVPIRLPRFREPNSRPVTLDG